MMALFLSMLTALSLTLVLELLFALVWGIRRKGLLLVFLMNVMTNPAANLLHYIAVTRMGLPALWVVLFLELAVVIAEGFCCKDMIRRPWLFAVLINAFSYTIGLLIR